ncbi:family 20 glycosylhydrolase [Clostridium nigeriense]|uniref:family 20 glycosylhydrolase n=1 Tax=Clostridium nigeriense TaxID=1805470 RepID=UPI003D33C62C
MKRFIAKVLCAFMIVSTFSNVTFAEERDGGVTETKTFPQVQSYTSDKSGYWRISNNSRFYILESEATLNNNALYDDVKLISSEFAAKNIPSNSVLDIVIGPEDKIKSGDIVVSIEDIVETDNEEGYKVEIKEDIIKITSSTKNGLFYGMRTVEKALIGNDGKMNLGTIVDYPEVSVRSFHLDLARKFFTKDWIISMIKDLSYQNISSMQVHFSENEGFRLESSVLESEVPGFQYPSDGYYTKEDMKEIIDVAKKYHIEIIPSLDSPGHLNYVLNQIETKTGRDLSVRNLFPSDSRKNQTFNIFESEEARSLLLDMIDEYANFFSENGSTRMNIGGDEFLANFTAMTNDQYKTVIEYFNDASSVVKKYGMTPRAWNDGLLVEGYDGYKLDSDIEICYWGLGTGSAPVNDFIENGNKLVNYVDAYMYYALSPWWMQYANAKGEKIYGEWVPGKMNSLPGGISQDFANPYPDELLGASYALWCDLPNYQSQDVIETNLFMRTRSMADKVWSPNGSKVNYSEFEAFLNKLGRVPGYKEELPESKDVIHVDDIEEDKDLSTLTGKELSSLVLPIVQSYEVASKAYLWKMDESTRFVIPNTEEYLTNSRLKEVVELVSAEFLEKEIPTAKEINKVYASEEEITTKDIVITLDKDNIITENSNSDEAYKIEIGDEGVKIVAASENAAMYALRTIQHLMVTNNNALVYGSIVDYPNLVERRVHVDMARKYISKDWIIQHIRELSYMKMNTIQLHFSENLGFRIESEFDPEIVSQDGYLTKLEIKEILEEARKYGINVIPSLDTPGHVEHILKVHPEYGQVDKYGNKSTVALDVTNPEAINYIKGLYSEYMELFEGSTDFHIGADEYMEFDRAPFTTNYKEVLNNYAVENFGAGYTWKDTMANYINEIAEHVYKGGFTPRIWNDGIYYGENSSYENKQQIKMHDYITIDFWSQMSWNPSIAKLNTFIEKGHKDIYNINASFFYYVLRPSAPTDGREQHSFDYLNQDVRIYNEWSPGKFQGNTIDDNSEVIKGASLAIWCDNPNLVTEDVITEDISKELRSLATKSWNTRSNTIATIEKFKENYSKLGNAAGFEKGSELPSVGEVLPLKELGKVTLKYVTNTGKILKDDIVKYGVIGTDYSFEADEIYGYSLISEEAVSGKFDEEEKVYTFIYELSTDKIELKKEIENQLDEASYIRETYKEYKEALVKAREVDEADTSEQKEVDEALNQLLSAKKKAILLEYYPLYIETEYPLNSEEYISGYEDYLEAVNNGKTILYSDDINTTSMKEAFKAIKAAKENLIKRDGNIPTVTATDKTYTHSGASWQGPYFPPEKYALSNMVDGDITTKAWFADNQNVGDEIILSFQEQVKMSKIQIVQPSDVGEDLIGNADVEISTEQGEWTKVGTLTKEDGKDKTISFEETPVKFVRIVIKENASKWYQIAEIYFTYEQPEESNVLKDIIIEAEELDVTDKNLNLLSNMVDALIEAQKAYVGNLEDTLQIEDNLREAIDKLMNEVEEVFKRHLEIAVEEAEKITEEELSKIIPIVVTEFKESLKEAKLLLEDSKSTQEQINASFDRLSKVMHMLSFEKGDKKALNSLIEKINELEEKDYIKETWDNMQSQLENAVAVAKDENALETEVSKAYKDLIKSFLDLRLKPNKDKLRDLIDKSEKELKEEDYTKESWSNFKLALDKAKTVYSNEDSNQEEIDIAITNLTEAKEKLVATTNDNTNDKEEDKDNNNKDDSTKDDNNNNVDNNNDNKDNSNNNKQNDNNNVTNTNKGHTNLPNTGAIISSAVILAIAVALTVGGILMLKKKKEQE